MTWFEIIIIIAGVLALPSAIGLGAMFWKAATSMHEKAQADVFERNVESNVKISMADQAQKEFQIKNISALEKLAHIEEISYKAKAEAALAEAQGDEKRLDLLRYAVEHQDDIGKLAEKGFKPKGWDDLGIVPPDKT